ncbi:MAG: S-methyl-5'-thioadenosine phosphorylase [Dehalococcoidia bacterium]
MSQPRADLAIIGGSGFYDMPGASDWEEVVLDTPFGPPSDAVRIGGIAGRRVAFLARHGRGHRLLPAEIPQRANLWALKTLGVQRVVAVSAVGSLSERLGPGAFVVPDQIIDRTNGVRPATFFGDGVVAHVGMAAPYCEALRGALCLAAGGSSVPVHSEGSLVVIEGPAFGTRAESHLYRQWGASLVGMTGIPEAKLAREAELCYALLATVTDYDSWHESEATVDAATVFRVLRENVATAQQVVLRLIASLGEDRDCDCGRALDSALVTPPDAISPAALARLAPILDRRLGGTP